MSSPHDTFPAANRTGANAMKHCWCPQTRSFPRALADGRDGAPLRARDRRARAGRDARLMAARRALRGAAWRRAAAIDMGGEGIGLNSGRSCLSSHFVFCRVKVPLRWNRKHERTRMSPRQVSRRNLVEPHRIAAQNDENCPGMMRKARRKDIRTFLIVDAPCAQAGPMRVRSDVYECLRLLTREGGGGAVNIRRRAPPKESRLTCR